MALVHGRAPDRGEVNPSVSILHTQTTLVLSHDALSHSNAQREIGRRKNKIVEVDNFERSPQPL